MNPIQQHDDCGWLKVLENANQDEPGWSPDDFKMLLRHQLHAPLELSVGAYEIPGPGEPHPGIKCLADLFASPSPPLALLRLAKNFGKRNYLEPGGVLPRETALAIYLASISSAMLRLGQKITSIESMELRLRFEWAAARPWMDEKLKLLFEAAARRAAQSG